MKPLTGIGRPLAVNGHLDGYPNAMLAKPQIRSFARASGLFPLVLPETLFDPDGVCTHRLARFIVEILGASRKFCVNFKAPGQFFECLRLSICQFCHDPASGVCVLRKENSSIRRYIAQRTDATGDAIQLYGEQVTGLHPLRQHFKEIAHAAGGLPDTAPVKTQIIKARYIVRIMAGLA